MFNMLKASQQTRQLMHVLDDLSANVMVADNDRNIVYLNKAVCAFLARSEAAIRKDLPEFSVEGLVGKNIDIFHKKPAHQKKLLSGLSGQFDAMIEVGGAKFDLMARPVMDGQKRIGTMVEWRDAANRIAREDAQAQVEAIRRTQAVISFLPDGTILDANELFCGATGYQLDEIAGKHHSIFVDPEEREGEPYKAFWEALATGKPQTGEFKRVRRDGSDLWIQASYTALLTPAGEIYKVVKFAHDISDVVADRMRRQEAQTAIGEEFGLISGAISTANSQAGTVADASDQASQNVQAIAAGIEEFLASVNEISRQVVEASTISQQAEQEAQNSTQIVGSLAESANEIENVVKLISDIAEQTNLLALNATIEAARAGEAGKGFAVVASEVKSLATQTSKATDEIGQRIGRVQASTDEAVQAIQLISDTVVKINEITVTISSAVEEQSAATGEMSSSMQVAADGVRAINEGVREIAQATEMVDNSAQNVQKATAALG
ncbi:MAG: hypothetical protein Rhims3KO_23250 [Hyphomicrobiales bacterium]